MAHTQVDGIDYTPNGIEALRQDVIKMRDQSLSCEPVPDFHTSVILSHTIALLAHLIDLVKEKDKWSDMNKPGWTNPLTDMES